MQSFTKQQLQRWCFILGALLLGVLLLMLEFTDPANAQTTSNNIEQKYIERVQKATFSTMPPTEQPGSFDVPGLGVIQWQAGQTPDEYFRLGNFYDSFNLQQLNFESISLWSGMATGNLTLADVGLFSDQNLGNLVTAIPSLGQWQVYQVPIFEELLSQMYPGNTAWDELTLQEVISRDNLGGLALNRLDLSKYSLDAVPGLLQTPLGRLNNWEQTFISDIPGLKDVPFAAFPGAPSGTGYVALIDVSFGKKEAQRLNTITGSYQEGFNVPCDQDSCSYIELSGPPWLNAVPLHGKQWIKGGKESDAQMVRGGFGLLAAVNGGMEPTGRHPYGRGFKVVLRETIESEGATKFAVYFRYCNDLGGCTPYFIGPIPWFNQSEDSIIFVGLTQADEPPPDAPSHPGLPPGTEIPKYPAPTNTPNPDSSTPIPGVSDVDKGECVGKLSHPASGYPINSGFGMRVHPITGRRRLHAGIDYGTPYGTPIKAADGGSVVHAGWMRGYGNTVDVRHCDGRLTRSAHLSTIQVSRGAVAPLQIIGRAGSTGNSTGPHLHFEVHVSGRAVDPLTQLGR